LYLAFVGIMIILFSFPVTSMIYTGFLGCLYFGSLHNLVIFIVLGIAADDIFVFIDGWRLSKTNKQFEGNIHKRMAFAFRRAARAMAVTSSTTSVAFMANVFSPLMPIRGFGIYSGVIVPVNYLLVVMILPPAVIW
jgi:predicted RND superfamily exporter protein